MVQVQVPLPIWGNMALTKEQLDLIERHIKYGFYKSMRQLRKAIREDFKSQGWLEALKEFKMKNAGNFEVMVYFKEVPKENLWV